jgi:hypothetical protein
MDMGKLLITVGMITVLAGVIITYMPNLFSWFGRLPFDIRIENENSSVFIPITSMLVISLILTILMNLFSR